MDELAYRKLRNIISTCPKVQVTWTELVKGKSIVDSRDCDGLHQAENNVDKLRTLVVDFLTLVSGGDVLQLLDDVLHPLQKEHLPATASLHDSSGRKRLDKLNTLLKKSPPLKPWTMRQNGSSDCKIRLEVEVTARRCLSYLSGGHIVAILKDILYEDEKEVLSERYRLAVMRIGEAINPMKPKSKATLLNAVRQAGFSKDDLRERGWVFSSSLWKSAALFVPSTRVNDEWQEFGSARHGDTFPSLMPQSSQLKGSKQRGGHRPMERKVVTQTSVTRKKQERRFHVEYPPYCGENNNAEETDEDDENGYGGNLKMSLPPSPYKRSNNRMVVNNFVSCYSRSASSVTSSSEDEEELKQRTRLSHRNPMFPQIF